MNKKYFLYELRNNLSRIIIFTVFASALFIVGILSEIVHGSNQLRNSVLGWPTFTIITLVILVPVIIFSFTKKKRSVDLFYSLPISKASLTFIKLLVGWMVVIVPYTISFLLGVQMIAMTHSTIHIGYYFVFYGISLILGTGLYLFVTFIFQQANTIIDGLILIVMSSFVFTVIFATFSIPFRANIGAEALIPFYPLVHLASTCNDLIMQGTTTFLTSNSTWTLYQNVINPIIGYSFSILLGAGALIGFYFQTKKNIAERSEDLTTSWFGFRTQIPIYSICLLTSVGRLNGLVFYIIIILLSIIMTMIAKRTYKLHWKSWAMIGGFILVSGLLTLILYRYPVY